MKTNSITSKLLSGYSLLFFVFLYAPIILIVVFSFNNNPINSMIWDGFTFDWYRILFGLDAELTETVGYVDSTEQLISSLLNSLKVAFSATVISTFFGTTVALAVFRYEFKFKSAYRLLMHAPMVMPDIVLGIALLIFFVSAGVNLGSTTIIIGHCTFLSSYIFVVVSTRLVGMNSALEDASSDLGANEWQTFKRITLPIILPGIIGGALLSFVISMDDIVITYFINGVDSTTLPIFILSMIQRGVKPEINAIATLMLLSSVIIASLGIYFKSKNTHQ